MRLPVSLQATVMLLVCQTDADCYQAVEAVSAALVDQRCRLHLQGQQLGTDKGALQVIACYPCSGTGLFQCLFTLCQRIFGVFGTSRCQRLCIMASFIHTACSRHLQQKVANHLKAVPKGIVFLSRMSQLSPFLLPVLINGMSEHGSFQQDGRAISTAGG